MTVHSPLPEPRLIDGGAALELMLDGEPRRFHALWLRDTPATPPPAARPTASAW